MSLQNTSVCIQIYSSKVEGSEIYLWRRTDQWPIPATIIYNEILLMMKNSGWFCIKKYPSFQTIQEILYYELQKNTWIANK